jgi:hypothetical protein
MLRKLTIAFAATIAIGFAAIPTSASAAWHGHGGWHGGWRGPVWGWGWGYYGYPYAYGPGPYYGGCYRTVRVGTPYGPRWRRVWVCG